MSPETALRDSPAGQLIRQEVERRGPMSFHEFVEIALYHPLHGYYNQGGPVRGKSGDYFTSLQVSRLFPEIFADALSAMRRTLDSDQFTLVELGSGGGEFLEGVLEAMKAAGDGQGLRVWAVERSRAARDKLWRVLSRFPKCQVVASLDDIDWMGGLEGCVVSNELFDALPFHRLRWNGSAWTEIFVALKGGRLSETAAPLSRPDLADGIDTQGMVEGQEIEVRPAAGALLTEAAERLSRGYVMTFDYGHPRGFLHSPSRPQGTWQCFFKHQANTQPFERVGRQDITAHVDFTQLAQAGGKAGLENALFCSQGMFLAHVGQKRLEKLLAEATDENRRSITGAIQQLIHPDAMGEAFWTLVQSKSVDLPPELAAIPNRKKRLNP